MFRADFRLIAVVGIALFAGVTVAASAGLVPSGPAPSAVIATDARLGGDATRTRLIVDLSRDVELSAFTLADPYRVVVDLPEIAFNLPPKTGLSGRGLVKAFRYGLVMQGGSRIVLDATGPVRIDKAFVLDSIEGQPARLVLDLVPIDRESFTRALATESRSRRTHAPDRKAEREAAPTTGDTRPLVVVDAGHGGIDSGTTAPSGEPEKAIVLDFAQVLRERLEGTGKYQVIMTRTDDSFVPLAERVRIARAHKASLFISIHADALAKRDADTRGASIYTLSETASDTEAARLADAENKADVIAGVDLSAEPNDVADILIDLTQRETKSFSAQFARSLVTELKTAARLHRNPLKAAGFRVLRAPDVPSVLLELGYVSSPQDLKLLTSDAWRTRTADSIVQAVHTFFTTRLAGALAGSN